MEKHKCKLCSRTFSNGRALGGHMKAHLAVLPLPPKTNRQLSSESTLSSSPGKTEEKNPNKSSKFADPESSFNVIDSRSAVVQERESDADSRNRTRRRSKRVRKPIFKEDFKRPELKKPSLTESPASSISDTSPEEDVAMCLMMLSRDKWTIRDNVDRQQEEEAKSNKVSAMFQCEKCNKAFKSWQALAGHRASHKNRKDDGEGEGAGDEKKNFQCPFCFKVFGSGQALGGHKRSHLFPHGSSSSSSSMTVNNSVKAETPKLIDLNLPAPVEEEEHSVVSDAEFIK